jgi:hypothetical protein
LFVGDVIKRTFDLQFFRHQSANDAQVLRRVFAPAAGDCVNSEALEVVGQAPHKVALQPVAGLDWPAARVRQIPGFELMLDRGMFVSNLRFCCGIFDTFAHARNFYAFSRHMSSFRQSSSSNSSP